MASLRESPQGLGRGGDPHRDDRRWPRSLNRVSTAAYQASAVGPASSNGSSSDGAEGGAPDEEAAAEPEGEETVEGEFKEV